MGSLLPAVRLSPFKHWWWPSAYVHFPRLWSGLPTQLRLAETVDSFQSHLDPPLQTSIWVDPLSIYMFISLLMCVHWYQFSPDCASVSYVFLSVM